jgi:hypothetical protein
MSTYIHGKGYVNGSPETFSLDKQLTAEVGWRWRTAESCILRRCSMSPLASLRDAPHYALGPLHLSLQISYHKTFFKPYRLLIGLLQEVLPWTPSCIEAGAVEAWRPMQSDGRVRGLRGTALSRRRIVLKKLHCIIHSEMAPVCSDCRRPYFVVNQQDSC